MTPRGWFARQVLSAVALLTALGGAHLEAGDTELGGDVRYYQILSTDEGEAGRRHAELGIARLKLTSDFTDSLRLEVHGAVSIAAPGVGSGATSIAAGSTRRLLDEVGEGIALEAIGTASICNTLARLSLVRQ